MTIDPTHDPADAAARDAARSFRAGIEDVVDLDAAYARGTRPRTHGRLAVVAFAVLAIAGALVFARPDGDGDVEIAVDEDDTSTTERDRSVPDVDEGRAIAIGPGAPDDGKDSVGLPVAAEPATGLVDGQFVTVSGSGFPPDQSVGVVMCTREAGRDHGARGAEACNLGRPVTIQSDANGVATTEFQVQRILVLDGQEVDCASEPGRCLIGMGLVSDYDQSGGVLVDFDPSVPLPDPPTVSLDRTEGLADGQQVGVRIERLRPNGVVGVEQCADVGCTPIAAMNADADGTFDGDVTVYRRFGVWADQPTNVDCAVEACRLQFSGDVPGGRAIPSVAITFVVSDGDTAPPILRLLEPGPFSLGDTIRVEVSGVMAPYVMDVMLCTDDQGYCWSATPDSRNDDGGVQIVEFPIAREVAETCRSCTLTGSLHMMGTEEPTIPRPHLFPEPIEVVITG